MPNQPQHQVARRGGNGVAIETFDTKWRVQQDQESILIKHWDQILKRLHETDFRHCPPMKQEVRIFFQDRVKSVIWMGIKSIIEANRKFNKVKHNLMERQIRQTVDRSTRFIKSIQIKLQHLQGYEQKQLYHSEWSEDSDCLQLMIQVNHLIHACRSERSPKEMQHPRQQSQSELQSQAYKILNEKLETTNQTMATYLSRIEDFIQEDIERLMDRNFVPRQSLNQYGRIKEAYRHLIDKLIADVNRQKTDNQFYVSQIQKLKRMHLEQKVQIERHDRGDESWRIRFQHLKRQNQAWFKQFQGVQTELVKERWNRCWRQDYLKKAPKDRLLQGFKEIVAKFEGDLKEKETILQHERQKNGKQIASPTSKVVKHERDYHAKQYKTPNQLREDVTRLTKAIEKKQRELIDMENQFRGLLSVQCEMRQSAEDKLEEAQKTCNQLKRRLEEKQQRQPIQDTGEAKRLYENIEELQMQIRRQNREMDERKMCFQAIETENAAWLQKFEVEQSSWVREIWNTAWTDEHLKKIQTERLVEGCRLIVKTLRQELEEARNQLKKEVQLTENMQRNMQRDLQRVNEEANLLKQEIYHLKTEAKMRQGKLRIEKCWNETYSFEQNSDNDEKTVKGTILEIADLLRSDLREDNEKLLPSGEHRPFQLKATCSMILQQVTSLSNQLKRKHREFNEMQQKAVQSMLRTKTEISSLTSQISQQNEEIALMKYELSDEKQKGKKAQQEMKGLISHLQSELSEEVLRRKTSFEKSNALRQKITLIEQKLESNISEVQKTQRIIAHVTSIPTEVMKNISSVLLEHEKKIFDMETECNRRIKILQEDCRQLEEARIKRKEQRELNEKNLTQRKEEFYEEIVSEEVQTQTRTEDSLSEEVEKLKTVIIQLQKEKRESEDWIQEMRREQSSWMKITWNKQRKEENSQKVDKHQLKKDWSQIVRKLWTQLKEINIIKQRQTQKQLEKKQRLIEEENDLTEMEGLRNSLAQKEASLFEMEGLRKSLAQKEASLTEMEGLRKSLAQKEASLTEMEGLRNSLAQKEASLFEMEGLRNSLAQKEASFFEMQSFSLKSQFQTTSSFTQEKYFIPTSCRPLNPENQFCFSFRQSSILLERNSEKVFFTEQMQKFVGKPILKTQIMYRYDRFNTNFLNYVVEVDFPIVFIFKSKAGYTFAAFTTTVFSEKQGREPAKAFLASLSEKRVFLPSSKRGDTSAIRIEANKLSFGKGEFAVGNDAKEDYFSARCSFTTFGRRYFDVEGGGSELSERKREILWASLKCRSTLFCSSDRWQMMEQFLI